MNKIRIFTINLKLAQEEILNVKTLDTKLEKLRRGKYKPSGFIIADAKDVDMGGEIFCTGAQLEDASRPRSYPEYMDAMCKMVSSGLVDFIEPPLGYSN
jgi:hypothetical protein